MSLCGTQEPARPGRNSNQTLRLLACRAVLRLTRWAGDMEPGDRGPADLHRFSPVVSFSVCDPAGWTLGSGFFVCCERACNLPRTSPVIDGAHRHERGREGTRSSREVEGGLAETHADGEARGEDVRQDDRNKTLRHELRTIASLWRLCSS